MNMRSCIPLAVVIGLVNVQGFSNALLRQVLDNKYGRAEEANQLRTESKNIETLTDDSITLRRKDGDFSTVDDIITGNSQDELQNMQTLDEVVRFFSDNTESLSCQDKTCKLCFLGLCLTVVHQSDSEVLQVNLAYKSYTVFSQIFPAKDFNYCKEITIGFLTVKACVEIRNIRINDSQTCMDVMISTKGSITFSHTFSDLCI